jgi:hypothetical protein
MQEIELLAFQIETRAVRIPELARQDWKNGVTEVVITGDKTRQTDALGQGGWE